MASYAAGICEAFGEEPVIELGSRGQFDVFLNNKLIVTRKGGLIALLTRRPWPSVQDVIEKIQNAMQHLN